jgi:hypothetical protein
MIDYIEEGANFIAIYSAVTALTQSWLTSTVVKTRVSLSCSSKSSNMLAVAVTAVVAAVAAVAACSS